MLKNLWREEGNDLLQASNTQATSTPLCKNSHEKILRTEVRECVHMNYYFPRFPKNKVFRWKNAYDRTHNSVKKAILNN